jgi:hypothetical protein
VGGVDILFPPFVFSKQSNLEKPVEVFFAPGRLLVSRKGEARLVEPAFYKDKDVARRLNLSPSWVRGQRHKRAHGLAHIFNLEPRYIGSCPRYVAAEVEAFVASIQLGCS